MRVILWGAGNTGRNIWKKINCKEHVFDDNYFAFADNDKNIWGKSFCGKPVLSPEDVLGNNFDKIVVTSIYGKVIVDELQRKLEIPLEKIQLWDDYFHEKMVQAAYKNKYSKETNPSYSQIFDKNKLVVYTAIMGDYDDLKTPEFTSLHIDYVCFTNNRKLKSNVWEIRFIENNSLSDQLLARKVKLNPHLLLKEYDTSVWIDGKFKIQSDIRSYIEKYEKTMPMLCFPHFERECIYEEEAICTLLGNADNEKMLNQILRYYREGYPLKNGLYDTGCLVRKHNNVEVIKIMEEWEYEIMNFSVRDQISLPYICWKNNFSPDISDIYIENNQWLKRFFHK